MSSSIKLCGKYVYMELKTGERKKERRRDKMVYVMWSFMFGAVLPQMLLQRSNKEGRDWRDM
jgi:hypothetical protein